MPTPYVASAVIRTRHAPSIPLHVRPKLRKADRVYWVWLSRLWGNWRSALLIVKPDTVVRWQPQGFARSPSRPGVSMVQIGSKELFPLFGRSADGLTPG